MVEIGVPASGFGIIKFRLGGRIQINGSTFHCDEYHAPRRLTGAKIYEVTLEDVIFTPDALEFLLEQIIDGAGDQGLQRFTLIRPKAMETVSTKLFNERFLGKTQQLRELEIVEISDSGE